MAKILVVDDEPAILSLIRSALAADQHLVTVMSDPAQVRRIDLGAYDLIMLDVMMPGVDGFTLCREIRSAVDCPILFVTAKTLESDLMYGLGLGADDYIVKPFGIGALRARIQAHLRREGRERRKVLYLEQVRFNLSGKELFVQENKVPLTKSEYEICEFLARSRGQVFSKEHIYEAIFGYNGESDSSTITEHIKNIRAKLGKCGVDAIETIWGIGYKWKL
ncbi:response regulator transcription factor [Paenibacillus sp. MMS20-IR301]|uniref:response regulator transcription factor n=1 Tax=Paenibacillus sp. MMS20-IR301 TaxID=2895946 RepID=UPI0028EE1F89|nr:response regulator transcription factor [Paenibacillus sp. MMS20-IR301]WNS42338.1 response regulator transcription factor [Paenibacillus sp. MMS20-IR301]